MWIIPQGTLVNQFIRSMVRNLTVILIKEAELAARDLQLNPHFILNTLNLISLELIQNGNDELCETISALSRVIEYTLRTRSLLVAFSLDLANTQVPKLFRRRPPGNSGQKQSPYRHQQYPLPDSISLWG